MTTREQHTAQDWAPVYESRKGGGWYVTNLRYPTGAAGCVSRDYPDQKWRIVCDTRPFERAPTFRTRDDAAHAERDLVAAAFAALPPKDWARAHAATVPGAAVIFYPQIRGGDVVQLAPDTDRVTVQRAFWFDDQLAHKLVLADGREISQGRDSARDVVLFERPGSGPLDRRYTVGERVVLRDYSDRECVGVVDGVYDVGPDSAPWDVAYEIRTGSGGLIARGVQDMRPDSGPAPAVDQLWTPVKGGRRVYRVVSVDPGGVLADVFPVTGFVPDLEAQTPAVRTLVERWWRGYNPTDRWSTVELGAPYWRLATDADLSAAHETAAAYQAARSRAATVEVVMPVPDTRAAIEAMTAPEPPPARMDGAELTESVAVVSGWGALLASPQPTDATKS